MSDTADELLESHKFSPDGSIWAPETLQQVRDRLEFIDAHECDCDELPHSSALHDLAHDDVPVLLRVIEQLAPRRIVPMTDVVERAKAALEGTTEGPWGTDGELIASELVVEGPGVTSYKHAIANMETDYYAEEGADEGETYGDAEPWRPYEQMEADAEFIAQARTLVPELVSALRDAQANAATARQIIEELTDPDPCSFDHHGDCQAHGFFDLTPENPCGHEKAKRFLAAEASR